jgi:hypothetical protein
VKKLVVAFALMVGLVSLFAYAGDEKKTCHMGDKAAQKMEADGTAVEMTGKLLCKHCNLHQSETCEKVFQPSSDEKTLYPVCQHSKVDVEKVSEEGTALLNIKGKLVKCAEDGKDELWIAEATKVAEAAKK